MLPAIAACSEHRRCCATCTELRRFCAFVSGMMVAAVCRHDGRRCMDGRRCPTSCAADGRRCSTRLTSCGPAGSSSRLLCRSRGFASSAAVGGWLSSGILRVSLRDMRSGLALLAVVSSIVSDAISDARRSLNVGLAVGSFRPPSVEAGAANETASIFSALVLTRGEMRDCASAGIGGGTDGAGAGVGCSPRGAAARASACASLILALSLAFDAACL